jgi:hypothetical protein
VNLAHHRSDQALDVSAQMGLSPPAVFQRYAVFLTASHHGLRMKLFGVVDVDEPR